MDLQYTLEEIKEQGQLIVPGNLIITNGSVLTCEELIDGQKAIYAEGKDVYLNGATMNLKGKVFVGGSAISIDTNSAFQIIGPQQ